MYELQKEFSRPARNEYNKSGHEARNALEFPRNLFFFKVSHVMNGM
jgi:hypothetical protein